MLRKTISLSSMLSVGHLSRIQCQIRYDDVRRKVFHLKNRDRSSIHERLEGRMTAEEGCVILIEEDSKAVGFIVCYIQEVPSYMALNRKGYIAETVVSKDYRGKGIGKKLFDQASTWFKEHKADHIELQVSPENKTALKFWTELGFSVSTQHMIKPI